MRGRSRSFCSWQSRSSSSMVLMRKCSKMSAMLFGPEALDLEELERGGRELCEQHVAPLAGAALDDFREHGGEAFADAGNVGDLALGVAQDVGDALGIAFDGGGAVAVAADAEAVFAGDLHQIGGFPEHARDFFVLHVLSLASTGKSVRKIAGDGDPFATIPDRLDPGNPGETPGAL